MYNQPEYSLEVQSWSWISNILVTWCEELTHWERPWCWERLRAGGEGDDIGWDGWMASLKWTWVWVDSGNWWWTGRPGVLWFMGSQRVRHDWATKEQNIIVVQLLSHVQLFATPWTAAHQAFLSFTTSWSLLKLRSTESVMPSNHLVVCRPLLLPPSIFPSIRDFPNESALRIRWPKYWPFSLSISPSNE